LVPSWSSSSPCLKAQSRRPEGRTLLRAMWKRDHSCTPYEPRVRHAGSCCPLGHWDARFRVGSRSGILRRPSIWTAKDVHCDRQAGSLTGLSARLCAAADKRSRNVCFGSFAATRYRRERAKLRQTARYRLTSADCVIMRSLAARRSPVSICLRRRSRSRDR